MSKLRWAGIGDQMSAKQSTFVIKAIPLLIFGLSGPAWTWYILASHQGPEWLGYITVRVMLGAVVGVAVTCLLNRPTSHPLVSILTSIPIADFGIMMLNLGLDLIEHGHDPGAPGMQFLPVAMVVCMILNLPIAITISVGTVLLVKTSSDSVRSGRS